MLSLSQDAVIAPTGLYEKYIVRRALNYVLSTLTTQAIASQPANATIGQPLRDPCVGVMVDVCTGLRPSSNDPGYATGIAMLPFAGSGALNRVNTEVAGYTNGKTYGDILQRMANALAWGQGDSGFGRGGWHYNFNSGTFDGSTVGWALLGFLDAEAAGTVIPAWVKTEFAVGLNNALNTNGSLDYTADGNAAALNNVNLEKAGIGLQGLFFIGETTGPRVASVVSFINARWTTSRLTGDSPSGWNCGTRCAYSMFNNFKGLKLQGINTMAGSTRPAGPGAIPAGDWYAECQDWLVANQTAPTTTTGGLWNTMPFSPIGAGTITMATAAVAELILSPVALVLPDGDKFASVGLTPETNTAIEGGTHTVTAHAESTSGTPVAGATVHFTILSGPNAGQTGIGTTDSLGNASFTYTDAGPDGTFGQDLIRAAIGVLNSNTVEMNWTPKNRPPVAVDDAFAVDEDGALNDSVLGNDGDPDGDVITVALGTPTSNGALVLNPDGTFSYTPNANFHGVDSFTYSVHDGKVAGNTATVTITVTPVNDPPTANDDTNVTDEDVPVSGTVTGADLDGDALTFSGSGATANGSVVVNADGTYTYTPNADFHGTDSFTFIVNDGNGGSATATVTITVRPVNDAPVAEDGTATTSEDTPVGGTVTATDLDGDSLTFSGSGATANGNVVVNADGTYTYTPNANFHGTDSFTFSVSDGNGGADTGLVVVTVSPVNDPPVAGDDAFSTSEDALVGGTVLPNDSDLDGDMLTVSLVSGPSSGTLVLNPNGTFTYLPALNFNGVVTFTYVANDGTANSNVATVTITVTPVNDTPECSVSGSLTEIWPPNHKLVPVALSGATDVDGDTLTTKVVSIFQDEPTNTQGDGNTSVDAAGIGTSVAQVRAERSGTPKTPGNGRMYHINYTVTDGAGGSCSGTVNVGVPHDQGKGRVVIDGGALFNSLGF